MKKQHDEPVVAKQHTPLYLTHRYFARRPHNVFSSLIERYSKPGDVVLDPFLGGGTTLVEALTCNRRVIGQEISPLACFVAENQISKAEIDSVREAATECLSRVERELYYLYRFQERTVYWYGWESIALCPSCEKLSSLSPDTTNGAGRYQCTHCDELFKPLKVHRDSVQPTSISVFGRDGISPEILRASRRSLAVHHEALRRKLESINGISENHSPIPKCNLEKESALHAKGFLAFEDFIPQKNQAWIRAFANEIPLVAQDEVTRKALLFVLSATLRYVSRFSALNPAWRKGLKPLEWAKSNFWTPYAFVEVNPSVPLSGRLDAFEKGLIDVQRRDLIHKIRGSSTEVANGKADYSLVNAPSQRLIGVPSDSIDLILTDPPYGSYLNYGELCAFWLCWLRKFDVQLADKELLDPSEAVSSRKTHRDGYKSFDDYRALLQGVFGECFRTLKPGASMVFTFNNKEPEAWIALLAAIKTAGFELPRDGVSFQDGVKAYKRTISLRRAGAIHGDFVYRFRKPLSPGNQKIRTARGEYSWRDELRKIVGDAFLSTTRISTSDLYFEINKSLIPAVYRKLRPELVQQEGDLKDFTMKNLDAVLNEMLVLKNGSWQLRR